MSEDITYRTIAALRRFAERLESGEPIPVTTITIEHTPDGPLTTRGKSTLQEWMEKVRAEGSNEH